MPRAEIRRQSRFDARIDEQGDLILYNEQDTSLWDTELIRKGEYFLNCAASGNKVSRYHLEAGIAFWHTHKDDSKEKWENILQLYNQLLIIDYSPIAALNRTYALAKANSKEEAIAEAEKLNLTNYHFYYALLGELYTGLDSAKAAEYFEKAAALAKSPAEKRTIQLKLDSEKAKTLAAG